jgi:hypothetical protein
MGDPTMCFLRRCTVQTGRSRNNCDCDSEVNASLEPPEGYRILAHIGTTAADKLRLASIVLFKTSMLAAFYFKMMDLKIRSVVTSMLHLLPFWYFSQLSNFIKFFRTGVDFYHFGRGPRGTNVKKAWVLLRCLSLKINRNGVTSITVVSARNFNATHSKHSIGCRHNDNLIAIHDL